MLTFVSRCSIDGESTFVMMDLIPQYHANSDITRFFSSESVIDTHTSADFIPSSSKTLSSMPSPHAISAVGSCVESSMHRFLSFSRIITCFFSLRSISARLRPVVPHPTRNTFFTGFRIMPSFIMTWLVCLLGTIISMESPSFSIKSPLGICTLPSLMTMPTSISTPK